MHRAYGRAIVPGKFYVTVEAELLFPRSYLEIGIISINGTAYMTNVLNGEWGEVSPESLPINLSNFGEILARIVDKVQSPELLEEDSLDGADVYRIGGSHPLRRPEGIGAVRRRQATRWRWKSGPTKPPARSVRLSSPGRWWPPTFPKRSGG